MRMKGWMFQRVLSSQKEFTRARQQLATLFDLQSVGTRNLRRTWFDTFDLRLLRARCWLELDADDTVMVRLRGAGGAVECTEQALAAVPPQPLVLPSGPVGAAVQPLRGGRALLGRLTLPVRVTEFRLLDDEGKVRALLAREQVMDGTHEGRGRTRLTILRLAPLRGYEGTCRRLMADIAPVLSADGADRDPAEACLALQRGRRPEPPSTTPAQLRPRQPATRALGLILLGQLRIMEDNVDGIRDDTDNEFLHDFRIACRRSRSLLTQVRGVFPTRGAAPFRESFAWLSRITSPQRDLDVFLAALPGLADGLSGRHARALAPLRELLLNRRREEHERLVLGMDGARFREFLPQWRQYLGGFAGPRAPRAAATPTAMESANATLRRLYRRLLRNGTRCGVGTYSPVLHELRKDGKKLRYVLEAYRTLYPAAETDRIVRRLRKLQGVLGDIVDCHVQREWLRAWQHELLARADTDPSAAVAMTALGEHLDRLETSAQQGFMHRFGQFAAAPVHEAMAVLLEPGP